MDARKQSLYLPPDVLDELRAEARRLDRSLSWIVQRAMRYALPTLRETPAVDRVLTRRSR